MTASESSVAPVAIIMGSRSDWPTMKAAAEALAADEDVRQRYLGQQFTLERYKGGPA